MNPVFSAAHLRDMTHIFYNVARKVGMTLCFLFYAYVQCMGTQMRGALAARIPGDGTARVLDMNGWMAWTMLEMPGQTGLGGSFNNFVEDVLWRSALVHVSYAPASPCNRGPYSSQYRCNSQAPSVSRSLERVCHPLYSLF